MGEEIQDVAALRVGGKEVRRSRMRRSRGVVEVEVEVDSRSRPADGKYMDAMWWVIADSGGGHRKGESGLEECSGFWRSP